MNKKEPHKRERENILKAYVTKTWALNVKYIKDKGTKEKVKIKGSEPLVL
jgi:hypothetical protein